MSLSDRLYGEAKSFDASPTAVEQRTSRPDHLDSPLALRLAFIAACSLAAASAILLTGRSVPSADPDLATLLKGMAIIKSGILLLAAGAIWWRLGSAIRPAFAVGYIVFAALAAGGAALVWNMAGLGLAPFLFDGGLLGFLILALRDDNGPWLRSLTRARTRRSE